MKPLGKIKLNNFSKEELDQRKLNALKGGCACWSVCGCVCAAIGGEDNTSDSVGDKYTDSPTEFPYSY